MSKTLPTREQKTCKPREFQEIHVNGGFIWKKNFGIFFFLCLWYSRQKNFAEVIKLSVGLYNERLG